MTNLFQNILTASFHGSIVIVVVLLLRLVLRKAPKKYLYFLWLLAGIRLLMPFEIQSELSLQPQSPADVMIRWEAPTRPDPAEDVAALPPEAPAVSPEAAPSSSRGPAITLSTLLPYFWLGVGTVFLVYSAFSYVNLRKKVQGAVKIPGGWESAGIDTAFILGFIKPKIYIPQGMAPATRKHILAHERTHLDKGDHWIKMIGFLALALHWFNPLVWVAYILLCKDIEMACDERVIQFMELPERKEYSAALLDCSAAHPHFAASPVAFGEVSVKSRIVSILTYRIPSFWLGLVSVIAIAFVTVCLVTSPTEPAGADVTAQVKDAALTETVPPPEEPVSDWGFQMFAEPHNPTTMTLTCGLDISWDGTPIVKDRAYWLERWDGESWTKLPQLVQEPRYTGSSGMTFDSRAYYENDLDWTLLYGSLPQGWYRVGIEAMRNSQLKAHYAQFRIWASDLTEQEAEAVERCETALALLTQQDYYKITLLESNGQGGLAPVRTLYKTANEARVDSFVGDICYNSYYCDASNWSVQNWDDGFHLKENKQVFFPKGESVISNEKVQFLTSWVDADGVAYEQVNTYTFAPDGTLTGADRLTRHVDGDGVTVQSQRAFTLGEVSYKDTAGATEMPKDSLDSAAESPWGIFFRVDDDYLSPSGGEVWFSAMNTIGVVSYTTDGSYWLEKKGETRWEKLESQMGDPSWGEETHRLSSQTTVIGLVDWTPYYGELEPGLYRMGKHFYDGGDSTIQYAEFLILPESNIFGEGGQEAMARVDAAIQRARSGDYHITLEEYGGLRVPSVLTAVFWKHDGVCVTDYYDFEQGQGYQHSALNDDPSDELFYDQWLQNLYWTGPRYHIYFADGVSKISPQEITFAAAYTGSNDYATLTHCSVFFDESGNITRIEQHGETFGTDRKTVLTFQNTSEAEIAAWVEKIQAEQR